MMDKLRAMAPWQIMTLAVVTLLVVLAGGYFLVTTISKPATNTSTVAPVTQDLNSKGNRDVVDKLKNFQAPANVPQPNPIRTVDPNNPNQAQNPFR